jgi:ribonuclease P protein component
VLPAANRLKRPDEFRQARRGAKAARQTVVVHVRRRFDNGLGATGTPGETRVGFVVSKAIGNAVMRNLVKRRMRAVVSELLHDGGFSDGLTVVVRALPAAATTDFDDLRRDIAGAMRTALRRAEDGS